MQDAPEGKARLQLHILVHHSLGVAVDKMVVV